MANHPVSLRIPEEVRQVIEETAGRQRRTFSSVANEMLEEAVRMRRIPGIVFANEGDRRAAKIAGTGLDVWEIIRTYREGDEDWETLKQSYHWLDDRQLRAALAYAEAYPDDVNPRVREADEFDVEEVWRQYPHTRPSRR